MTVTQPSPKKRMSLKKKILLWIVGIIAGFTALIVVINIADPEGMAQIRAEQEAERSAKASEEARQAEADQKAAEDKAEAAASTPTETAAAPKTDKPLDALQAVAGSAKISATMEDGRVTVETDLIDPRGENGSPAAQQAIKICEAAAKIDGVTYVNVQEKDGTSWILYGHPSVPKGECNTL